MFYAIGTVALTLVSALIIFLIYSIWRIGKIISASMKVLNTAARETQHSVEALTKGWTQTTLIGLAFRMIRALINVGKG
jgi:hypothetical protein